MGMGMGVGVGEIEEGLHKLGFAVYIGTQFRLNIEKSRRDFSTI